MYSLGWVKQVEKGFEQGAPEISIGIVLKEYVSKVGRWGHERPEVVMEWKFR